MSIKKSHPTVALNCWTCSSAGATTERGKGLHGLVLSSHVLLSGLEDDEKAAILEPRHLIA